MKDGKMNRAMNYIDEDIIAGAMENAEGKKGKLNFNLKGKNDMTTTSIFKKWIAVAAMLAIVLTGALFIGHSISLNNASSIIALDVNPSIEIEVNGNEEVVEVKALNEEAVTVLGDMQLEGVKMDVAMNAIIGSLLTNGFISADQNSILISIDSESTKKAEKLEASLADKVAALLGNSNISASVITQIFNKAESEKQAEENHVSAAKTSLINKIVNAGLKDADGAAYTYERLVTLKVNELKLILDSKGAEISGITSSGTAGNGDYISKDEAIAAALERAGFAGRDDVTMLELEIDFDDDYFALVYEIEFRSGDKKYEYEINAKNGDILEESIEAADENNGEDDDVVLPEGSLTRDEALAIVLEDADVDRNDVKELEIEADYERGQYVYEIEFDAGWREYEYVIDAVTGEVINSRSKLSIFD